MRAAAPGRMMAESPATSAAVGAPSFSAGTTTSQASSPTLNDLPGTMWPMWRIDSSQRTITSTAAAADSTSSALSEPLGIIAYVSLPSTASALTSPNAFLASTVRKGFEPLAKGDDDDD